MKKKKVEKGGTIESMTELIKQGCRFVPDWKPKPESKPTIVYYCPPSAYMDKPCLHPENCKWRIKDCNKEFILIPKEKGKWKKKSLQKKKIEKRVICFDDCPKCGVHIGYWEDDKVYIEIPHKCGEPESKIEIEITRDENTFCLNGTLTYFGTETEELLKKLIPIGESRKAKLIFE